MPLFIIEREFADQLDLTDDGVREIEEINDDVGVRWIYSFLSADKKKTYCLYEAPSAELHPGRGAARERAGERGDRGLARVRRNCPPAPERRSPARIPSSGRRPSAPPRSRPRCGSRQPVFSRIARTWFAAVFALMCSVRPMSALLEPVDEAVEDLPLARGERDGGPTSFGSRARRSLPSLSSWSCELGDERGRASLEGGHPDRARRRRRPAAAAHRARRGPSRRPCRARKLA